MAQLIPAIALLFASCCLQIGSADESTGSTTGNAQSMATGNTGTSTGASSGNQTSSAGTSSGAASSTGALPPLFLPAVTYPVGTSPHALATLGLTPGAAIDLAVSNSVSGNVTILLNRGDGTFSADPFGPFPVGPSAGAICSADFNRDGIADLAVVSQGPADVTLLFGSPSADFGSAASFASLGLDPTILDLICGDWNRDGNPDVALVDSTGNTLQVAFGGGDGGLESFLSYGAGARAYGLTSVDLDSKDGPELAVANNYGSSISVFLNNGAGIFNLDGVFPLVAPPSDPQPVSIAAGDFDGKGSLDLAVVDNNNGVMCIFLNDGEADFVEQAATYPLGVQPQNVVTADFDSDGKLDLAVPVYDNDPIHPSSVAVLLGNGDGTFQDALYFSAGVGSGPIWIVTGDFNGDGKPDLATADFISDQVSVFLNGR